jgi:hypothetical protein
MTRPNERWVIELTSDQRSDLLDILNLNLIFLRNPLFPTNEALKNQVLLRQTTMNQVIGAKLKSYREDEVPPE